MLFILHDPLILEVLSYRTVLLTKWTGIRQAMAYRSALRHSVVISNNKTRMSPMPVGNHLPHGETAQGGPLKRELGERHIRLMALGACIGVGLFLGSAKAIEMAGPAIMLSYIIGGLAILVIMRALGEMAVHNPVAGSFSRYAQDYLGPLAGFLTGWNYWFLWLVTCVAEITAVAVYMGVWFPDVPRWIWALSALISMGTINLINVKAFGEFEFWFALIKIVTIVAMVILSLIHI